MRSIFPDRMPRWVMPTIVLLFVISWVPLSMVSLDRAAPKTAPRISIIPDMDKQEKFTAQAANPMFADGRAMRLPVAGTVAYGQAKLDDWYYRGIAVGQAAVPVGAGQAGPPVPPSGQAHWATQFPIKPTVQMMKRGQRQFNIYCSPCHGFSGDGAGMVAARANELMEPTWVPPANYHDKLVMGRPVGHIFNTITNGIRNMPPYGPQIAVEDRWAIVLYVRALQRSGSATLADVNDPGEVQALSAMRMSAVQQQTAQEQQAAAEKSKGQSPKAEDSAALGGNGKNPQAPAQTPPVNPPGGAKPK